MPRCDEPHSDRSRVRTPTQSAERSIARAVVRRSRKSGSGVISRRTGFRFCVSSSSCTSTGHAIFTSSESFFGPTASFILSARRSSISSVSAARTRRLRRRTSAGSAHGPFARSRARESTAACGGCKCASRSSEAAVA